MNKRINIATSSIVALIMLVAMAGVIASGLMQVNQEHNIAVEEQNTTKIIAQYMNSIKTTDSGVIMNTEVSDNTTEFSEEQVAQNETGFVEPLGATTAVRDEAKIFGTVMNIQALMLGTLSIGAVAVIALTILSSRNTKRSQQEQTISE